MYPGEFLQFLVKLPTILKQRSAELKAISTVYSYSIQGVA